MGDFAKVLGFVTCAFHKLISNLKSKSLGYTWHSKGFFATQIFFETLWALELMDWALTLNMSALLSRNQICNISSISF